MQGVALQSELHLFLRDEMGLEGVQRGRQKKAIGPDWLAAEQLDIQRKREAVEAALAAKEAALAAKEAADLVTSQAMQTVVELQLATGAKRNAEADALLAQAKSHEADLVTSKRQAEAFSAGMAAWSDGDLTAVQKDGVKSVSFRDVATKERLWPVIEPAFSQLWEWMTKAAATVSDRVAKLVNAATVDRDQASKERADASAHLIAVKSLLQRSAVDRDQAAKDRVAASAQAEATKTEADRVAWLVKAATNDRQQAAKDRADAAIIKEQAGAVLAQAEAWAAVTIADNEALQTRLEALETSEGMKRAIDAKITPRAVQDAVAAYVTPELIQQVVRRQVTEAQAVNSASAAAAMFAQRQREQGR